MSSAGIEAVLLETHNWGRTARFFRSLGFTLDFETDHDSGQLSTAQGAPVFVAEIPSDREPGMRIVLAAPDEPGPDVDVVTGFEDTHYGTREMTVRDPDGRLWTLRAPGVDGG